MVATKKIIAKVKFKKIVCKKLKIRINNNDLNLKEDLGLEGPMTLSVLGK